MTDLEFSTQFKNYKYIYKSNTNPLERNTFSTPLKNWEKCKQVKQEPTRWQIINRHPFKSFITKGVQTCKSNTDWPVSKLRSGQLTGQLWLLERDRFAGGRVFAAVRGLLLFVCVKRGSHYASLAVLELSL